MPPSPPSPSSSAATVLTEWCRLLIESLADAGIREVVLSPGSRSTPLTWAALRSGRLRCRLAIDEREAAFFAAGHAKVSGTPVLLICTSGSAAANYFPAIVEAAASATPLVVLTADRPFELQGCAASQTIDQVALYGRHVRHYADLGMPEAHPAALGAVRRHAAQAVATALSPLPGPVHLDVRARKPLEPPLDDSEPARALRASVDALLARPITRADAPVQLPPATALGALADAIQAARRGLIVLGPLPPWLSPSPETVARLVRASGLSVFAESTSGHRLAAAAGGPRIDALDVVAREPTLLARGAPDLTLELGSPAVAGAWPLLAAAVGDGGRHVITHLPWADPEQSAATMLRASLEPTLLALCELLEGRGPSASRRCELLEEADRRCRLLIEGVIEEARDAAPSALSELDAVRLAVDAVPEGGVLAVGNSLPVREVDLCSGSAARDIMVWSQRGAAGIDGLIAGAYGAAEAAQRPALLLLGDLSFLHGAGGLGLARAAERPFVVVAINNGGGRIFEQLPVARVDGAEAVLDAWTTPHDLELWRAAELYGLRHWRVDAQATGTAHERAAEALAEAMAHPGASVVELVVDAQSAATLRREIAERFGRELSSLLGGD